MGKILALLVALSFLAGAGHAMFEEFKESQGHAFDIRMIGWEALAVLAITICVFLNVIVWMMGKTLESEHLKSYAKSELLQVTASAFMIFFAVELMYGLSSGSAIDLMGDVIGKYSYFSCGAVKDGVYRIWDDRSDFGAGPMGAFKCKLQEKITALDSAYAKIFESNKGMEKMTSACFILFGVPVWCGDWDLGFHQQVEEAHLLCTKIVGLLMPLHGIYSLAEYVQKNMLTVFLPLGLLLRIMPITRGVGGLFIAIGIGFFFVWPIFYLLSDPSFVRISDSGSMNERQAGACYTGFTGAATMVQSVLLENAARPNAAVVDGTSLIFQLTISILFLPFVALVVTLIFIRAMTPLLGGDMGELMKMVARLG